MPDEEQGSYQAEVVNEVSQETQPEAAETVTTQEEAAPTGHRVKYNGEEKVVSYEEAPALIQKGMNYDKVSERAQQLEAQTKYLEKQAKIYGYGTVEEYTKAVDEHLAQQEIEQQARKMNVDPDTYAQYFAPVNQELGELRSKVQTYEQQQQQKEQQEQHMKSWDELYQAYPYLTEDAKAFNEGKNANFYTEQMQQLVNMGYQPVHAYELAHKDTLFKQKEQEVIAKLTGRDAKQVLSSVDSPNSLAFDPNNMTDAQIDDISRRVRNGERITF